MNSPQATSHDNSRRNARLKLLLVIFLFLGPLLAAFLWYYGFGASLAPAGQSNHSPLISPPVPLQLFENPTYDGELVDNNFLNKKWTIVHIIGESCNEFCKKSLYNTRQSRLALGKVPFLFPSFSNFLSSDFLSLFPSLSLPFFDSSHSFSLYLFL